MELELPMDFPNECVSGKSGELGNPSMFGWMDGQSLLWGSEAAPALNQLGYFVSQNSFSLAVCVDLKSEKGKSVYKRQQ